MTDTLKINRKQLAIIANNDPDTIRQLEKLLIAVDQIPGIASYFNTGDVKLTLATTASDGWVLMNDGTIGDASSGASARANADCSDLFTLLWTNIADAWCAVSGGRGATAAADWAAHKTIALPKVLGRALAAAGTGAGLTARALAETLGTESHQLVPAEMPVHTHTQNAHTHIQDAHTHPTIYYPGAGAGTVWSLSLWTASRDLAAPSSVLTGSTTATNQNATATNQNAGGDGTHPNMQPTTFLNVMIHL